MMKIEEKRKQFKLNSVTLDKIQKLKNAKELEIYSYVIVIQAIDLAYSAKFGKDVFDETIERLDTVISNSVHKLLLEHLNPMAEAFSNLYHQEELNKEASELIKAAKIPHTTNPLKPAGNNLATKVGNAASAELIVNVSRCFAKKERGLEGI